MPGATGRDARADQAWEAPAAGNPPARIGQTAAPVSQTDQDFGLSSCLPHGEVDHHGKARY
jgi:hypothetical protein